MTKPTRKSQSAKAARAEEKRMAKIAEEYGLDPLAELTSIFNKLLWRDIATAPKDQFILLWCQEDGSRWLAKWQGGQWYGVDDQGLTRFGHSAGDPNVVTGWFLNAWMPLPDVPAAVQSS